MSNITDRELLAFCSLSKLKLEFSQYKKEQENDDGTKDIEYRTIRQLIDLELEGQKERRTNQSDDIKKLRELEKKIIGTNTNSGIFKNEFENYHKQIQKIKDPENENKINIGMFYDSSEIKKNPLLYRTSDDLRKTAPMLMEYYDREQNKESNFLKEWEIVYAGDSYEISKRIYEEAINLTDKSEEEKKIKIAEFPAREKLKEYLKIEKRIKVAISIINFARSIYNSQPGDKPKKKEVTTETKKVRIKSRSPVKIGGQNKAAQGKEIDATRMSVLIDGKQVKQQDYVGKDRKTENISLEEAKLKEDMQKIVDAEYEEMVKNFEYEQKIGDPSDIVNTAQGIAELQEKIIELPVKALLGNKEYIKNEEFIKKDLLEYSIPLDITDINVAVLRKKDTKKDYVFIIEDNVKLTEINKKLTEGMIPREIFMLIRLVQSLNLEFGEDFMPLILTEADSKASDVSSVTPLIQPLILTGTDYAGKIAATLNMLLSDSKCTLHRGFYSDKPDNLKKLPEFTYGDISHYLEGGTNYESYKIIDDVKDAFFNSSTVLLVTCVMWGTTALNPLVSFMFWYSFFVPLMTKILKKQERKEHYKKLIKKLKILKIIDSNGRILEFKETYPFFVYHWNFKTDILLELDLESYIQMIYYRDILKMKVYCIGATLFFQTLEVGNSLGTDTWEIKKITRFMEYKDNSLINLRIHELTYYSGDEESVKTERNLRIGNELELKWMEEVSLALPDTIEKKEDNLKSSKIIGETQEDVMGKSLKYLLELFKNIQDNFDNPQNEIHYIKNEKPLKILGLAAIEKEGKENDTEKLQKIVEYNYFPYISKEKGNITQDLREEYIGSFLRSIYPECVGEYIDEYGNKNLNGKYFSLEKNILDCNKAKPVFGNQGKGPEVNEYFKKMISEKGLKYPHYKEVNKKIELDSKILEKFYEIEKSNKIASFVYIGHLKNKKKFDETVITYSYNTHDEILSRAIKLFVNHSISGAVQRPDNYEIYSDNLLHCDKGDVVNGLVLKVTAKNRRRNTKKGFLGLSEDNQSDNIKIREKIIKMRCKITKKDCVYMPGMEWQNTSEKDSNNVGIILNISWCTCKNGGIIKVKNLSDLYGEPSKNPRGQK